MNRTGTSITVGRYDSAGMESIRIGSGAAYAGDRIEPAVELSREADLDYLVFECLAERTTALAETVGVTAASDTTNCSRTASGE